MHWNNILRRALPIVLGSSLAPAVLADEVSYTDTIPLTTLAWVDSVTLPQFDPALGVLQGVEVSAGADLIGNLFFENEDAAPATVSITLDVTVDVQNPDASPLLAAVLQVAASAGVTAYDGSSDFAGSSGRTFNGLTDSAGVMTNVPPGAFAQYIGNGTIVFPVLANGMCSGDGSANLLFGCQSQAGAQVTVTYTFGADCNDNGIPDDQDIDDGTSQDCNNNGIPDECEPDCDDDGIPDDCEPDCDNDGIPDDCDQDPCPDCIDVNRRRAGSLLIYPEFDNRSGMRTVVSVTNTSRESDVRVHFIYIGRYGFKGTDLNCEEFDRTEDLTPNDTLTVLTNQHNPQQEQGFLYVYAVDDFGQAIAFDHLIGSLLTINGLDVFEYQINPVDFRAIPSEGELTDLDSDGHRDLNGLEYEQTADELLVPRFLGQGGRIHSQAIFLGLSGGAAFTTTAGLWIYNDNEEAFSAQHTFRCWDKAYLLDVSGSFGNFFLANSSGDDPTESLGGTEYGWYRVYGQNAQSGFFDILDPAVYVVHIEVVGSTAAADLPFELCTQNGHLFPRLLSGDNEE